LLIGDLFHQLPPGCRRPTVGQHSVVDDGDAFDEDLATLKLRQE
jgi:hypothetical protein